MYVCGCVQMLFTTITIAVRARAPENQPMTILCWHIYRSHLVSCASGMNVNNNNLALCVVHV